MVKEGRYVESSLASRPTGKTGPGRQVSRLGPHQVKGTDVSVEKGPLRSLSLPSAARSEAGKAQPPFSHTPILTTRRSASHLRNHWQDIPMGLLNMLRDSVPRMSTVVAHPGLWPQAGPPRASISPDGRGARGAWQVEPEHLGLATLWPSVQSWALSSAVWPTLFPCLGPPLSRKLCPAGPAWADAAGAEMGLSWLRGKTSP